MPFEIERKFKVRTENLPDLGEGLTIKQGYLTIGDSPEVRVRVTPRKGLLTLKWPTEIIRSRCEYNIDLDLQQATLLMDRALFCIHKLRFNYYHTEVLWQIDRFLGHPAELWLAEVELEHEDQEVPIPEWVGEEVTDDPNYYSYRIAKYISSV